MVLQSVRLNKNTITRSFILISFIYNSKKVRLTYLKVQTRRYKTTQVELNLRQILSKMRSNQCSKAVGVL